MNRFLPSLLLAFFTSTALSPAAAISPATAAANPSAAPEVFWSLSDMDRTPTGIDFHGPFSNGPVTASADQLPAHEWLEINVELFILRSWDGSVDIPQHARRRADGPDYLFIDIEKGPNLLYTTFSNTPDNPPGFTQTSIWQNFPSPVPGEKFKFQTGSAEHNSLGYNFPTPGPPQLVPMDAIYKLHYFIPHTSSDVTVRMTAAGLQNMIDENWGVRSVTIRPLHDADVPTPSEADLAKAFETALKIDTDEGQAEAFNTLVRGRAAAVRWMTQNVQAAPIDAAELARIVTNMSADDAHMIEREAASADVRGLGPQAEPALRDARRTAPGEVATRIDSALQAIGIQTISDESLRRVMLATRVLEVIGTPEALQLRRTLTQQ